MISPKPDIYLQIYFQITHKLFSLHILDLHEVETEHGNLIKQLIIFQKTFQCWAPHSWCLRAEGRSPLAGGAE